MFGNITDIQPAEYPGAYNVQLANGGSMLVHGDPAERLKQQFDAARAARSLDQSAVGPNALAQNDAGGAPQTASDAAPVLTRSASALRAMMHASPEEVNRIAAANPVMVNGRPKAEVEAEMAAAKGGAATAGAAPSAPAPTGPRPGEPLGYSMKAVDPNTGKEIEGPAVMTENGPRVYVAPKAGSPGGLTKLGKEAIAHQQSAEEKYAAATDEAAKAREEQTVLARDQAQREQSYLEERQKQLFIEQQKQQEENDQAQKRVTDLDAKYQQYRDDFKNSKVDPDRVMRGNWMATLGMALGAAGASLARTPNFAQNFVNDRIERDIRAQEKEIEVKGASANNALADLTRSQGSLQAGKLALKGILTDRAQTELQMIGSTNKDAAISAQAREAAAQLAAQQALNDQARKQGYLEHVMKDRMYNAPGVAGRSGGFLVPTQQSMGNMQEAGIKGRELGIKERAAEAKAGGEGKLGQRQASVVATARVARGAVQEMADALGVQRDDNGNYQAPDWSTIAASKVPYTDTREKVQALKNTLISEVGKAQTGGVLTEGAAKEMHDQINSLSTPGEYQAFMNHFDKTMAEVEKQNREVAKTARGSDYTDTAP